MSLIEDTSWVFPTRLWTWSLSCFLQTGKYHKKGAVFDRGSLKAGPASVPSDGEAPSEKGCFSLGHESHVGRAIPTSSPSKFHDATPPLAGPCSICHVSPGVPAESVYSKVQHFEGETLSVQCSYKNRKKHVEGKVWCKIRRKKCEPGFTRIWAPGPRYLLQDDAQAKVVNITMVALRRQDSGRYWCMRNSSGTLYPLMGFQLEVSPGEQACWGTGKVGVSPSLCLALTLDVPRIIIH